MLNKFIQGMFFGLGSLIFIGVAGFIAGHFLFADTMDKVTFKIKQKAGIVREAETLPQPVSVKKEFYNSIRVKVPPGISSRNVSNSEELKAALREANKTGNFVIYLVEGDYSVDKTLTIKSNNIIIKSISGNPYKTTISGPGMRSGIGNLIRIEGSGFKIDGITLTDASYHLIQVAGELDADYVEIRNMILQNAYQQLVKISYDVLRRPEISSDYGIIENSILQFTTGVAENFYTGGIDGIGAKHWQVKNNVFRDIASPSKRISQYAVHFWINAKNNEVINNVFINNDRAIGFGMRSKQKNIEYNHLGGKIQHNLIMHTDDTDPFSDTGIMLEDAVDVDVSQNYIYIKSNYPNAIEYRFDGTQNNIIDSNTVNKSIRSRDNGQATVQNNIEDNEVEFYLQKLFEYSERLNVQSFY